MRTWLQRLDILFALIAGLAAGSALAIWWSDGGWHDGALPTEGVIRTGLLGSGALIVLALHRLIANRRR